MNLTILTGRVLRTPQILTGSNGEFTYINIAVKKNFRVKQGEQDSYFYDVSVSGYLLDTLKKINIHKGDLVSLECNLRSTPVKREGDDQLHDNKLSLSLKGITRLSLGNDSREFFQSQKQQGGYNQQGQQGGYNQQGQQGGYNQQKQQGGYNQQKQQGQQGGYNQQNQQGRYNQQGQQGGYNQQNQQGGYNQQNQQGGYNQQNQQQGNSQHEVTSVDDFLNMGSDDGFGFL